MGRNISEELIKSANQIREKYRALKRGKFNIEEQRLEELKPLLDPLNKLVEDKKSENKLVVPQPPPLPKTPFSTPSRIPALNARPIPHSLQFGLIASKYLSKYLSHDATVDKTYGVRSENNKFYIGNKEVEIANDDVTIGEKTFIGTDGLWQLLTLKDPKDYTPEDLANYKEILLITNAHKKSYEANQAISSNKGNKYKTIIKPMFTSTGEGLKEVTGNKIDYVY